LRSSPIVRDGAFRVWYTYAGLRANRLLADLLLESIGEASIVTNTSIKIRSKTFAIEAFSERLRSLASLEAMTVAVSCMATIPRVETKFDERASADEFAAFARERVYDLDGATAIAERGLRVSVSPADPE
jgi:hypothetical protein